MPNEDGFHPELRMLARFMPRKSLTPRTLGLTRTLDRVPFGRRKAVESLTLTSGRRVRLYRPAEDGGPAALLWLHGGGYVAGTPDQSDEFCVRLGRRLGITVAAPEYRLAPEHPYPEGLEDCYAALKWLASLPSVDPSRVAIGGESGGGGLAAALAFVARDRGEISPALQLLNYPMLDDRAVANPQKASNYRMWNERSNRFAWDAYLGGADPDVAVPARRTDLSGLAPAWIGVGTEDIVHDESVAYAARLKEAGVPCDLEVVQGGFHTFDRVAVWTEVSKAYFRSQCTALRDALAL